MADKRDIDQGAESITAKGPRLVDDDIGIPEVDKGGDPSAAIDEAVLEAKGDPVDQRIEYEKASPKVGGDEGSMLDRFMREQPAEGLLEEEGLYAAKADPVEQPAPLDDEAEVPEIDAEAEFTAEVGNDMEPDLTGRGGDDPQNLEYQQTLREESVGRHERAEFERERLAREKYGDDYVDPYADEANIGEQDLEREAQLRAEAEPYEPPAYEEPQDTEPEYPDDGFDELLDH